MAILVNSVQFDGPAVPRLLWSFTSYIGSGHNVQIDEGLEQILGLFPPSYSYAAHVPRLLITSVFCFLHRACPGSEFDEANTFTK